MSLIKPRTRLRRGAALLALGALALQAALPRPARAACGPLDLGGCVDNAEYSLYYGVSGIAWSVNRWLLILAYQLDQLRTWLIDVAFTSAYQWLSQFVEPAYVPIATAALMLAAILFTLVPLTGESGLVSIRHVLTWMVLTPLVLAVAGQLIAQAERTRSEVSAQLFAEMSGLAPGAIFGGAGSHMAPPAALYPANPCGTTLARSNRAGLTMDALAAALLYADAGDIHCPDARGPSPDIPDAFYQSPPGYAFDGFVGDLDSSVERRAWVEGMQRGMGRLLQGLVPSLLAVLESLIHLIFSLSMVVLWLALPIGLLFVWFQQTASPVRTVLQRAAAILIGSWVSSLLLGLISAALVAAAQLGNAGAYTGMAFGGLFLVGYLCFVALSTLWRSLGAVEQAALSAAGLSLTQPLQAAATLTAAAGAAVATGGAGYLGLAAAGSTAFAQSEGAGPIRRSAYTLGAMAGRLPGVGAVGEVAAAMGWVDDDDPLYRGVYAGDRSRYHWKAARLQMERDAELLAPGAPAAKAPPPGPGGGSGPPPGDPPAPQAPAQATGVAPDQPVVLPLQHRQRAAAALQVGALPHPDSGDDWQYVSSQPEGGGYRHTFQHPRHPLTGRPETRTVVTGPPAPPALGPALPTAPEVRP